MGEAKGRFIPYLVVAICCFFATVIAAADTVTRKIVDFDIPTQRADLALTLFAEQVNLTLVFPYDEVRGKMANQLTGEYEVASAIEVLLKGTGLKPSFSDRLILTITIDETRNEMKTNKNLLATVIGFLMGAGGAHDVIAQSGGPGGNGSTNPAVEEIVVTAQKRAERLLDVPMSITAISYEQLLKSGVGSTGDLQQVVPGLTTVNNGLGFVPVIRGISSQNTSPGDESNVSIYLDDVYLGPPMAGLFDLADIERIEVLKGPQGTLFGRNATGGAIRIVTRKPSFEPEANLSLDYGVDYKEWNTSAFLSGPLSDTVAGSISGILRQGDGYIDGIGPNEGEDYGDPDNYLVRGKLLIQLSDSFSALVTVDTMEAQNDAVATVWPPQGAELGGVTSQPFRYAGSTQPRQRLESESMALDINWEPSDSLAIRSITAYRDLELDYQSDIDRTSASNVALHLGQYQKNFSQEVNVSGSLDTVDWLAGLYYYQAEAGNPFWKIILGDAPTGTSLIRNFDSQVDTSSYAGFGEVTLHASDQLHFILGARYTSETKEFSYQNLLAPAPSFDDEETWTSPTYRAVVRYDFQPDANVYASLSNGFKSGVYDAYSSLGNPVDPEKLTAFEIGAKARINGITLTAAAYAYDYKEIQVSSFATVDGVIVLSLSNAGSAEMSGLELTADGPLTDNLSFNAGFNWAENAQFKEFTNAQVTVPLDNPAPPVVGEVVNNYDASGSRIPRTPEWTANLGFTYTVPLLDGELSANVSAFFSPGFYWQPGNLTKESSYEVVGTRLAWTDPAGRFTYSLWGTNLTDSDNSIYRVPNRLGDSMVAAQGRQIGVGIAMRM